MQLVYNGCSITLEDNLIKCSYAGHFDEEHWEITLNDTNICYKSQGKKEVCFTVNKIQEFQFEMGNGAYRQGDIPAAITYVILKADTDPKDLFHFSISEKYVLLNQTKAYEFCNNILNHIGERYGIPVAYKLSIDTRKKQRAVALLPLLFVIIILTIWLSLRYGR